MQYVCNVYTHWYNICLSIEFGRERTHYTCPTAINAISDIARGSERQCGMAKGGRVAIASSSRKRGRGVEYR